MYDRLIEKNYLQAWSDWKQLQLSYSRAGGHEAWLEVTIGYEVSKTIRFYSS